MKITKKKKFVTFTNKGLEPILVKIPGFYMGELAPKATILIPEKYKNSIQEIRFNNIDII